MGSLRLKAVRVGFWLATVFTVWAAQLAARFFRLHRYLPKPLCWFRPGRCTICGDWGWVFWQTGEHEDCWLEIK